MTAREWKPGDVAIVDGPGQRLPITFYTNDESAELMFTNGSGYQHPARHLAKTARSLVVIDAEDREQVKRLNGLVLRLRCRCGRLWLQESPRCEWHKGRHDRAVESRSQGSFEELADALREFANPTTPKPPEPTGLGAVVEDEHGGHWVRVWNSNVEGSVWTQALEVEGCSVTRSWDHIDAVRVLSEGVTA